MITPKEMQNILDQVNANFEVYNHKLTELERAVEELKQKPKNSRSNTTSKQGAANEK